MRKILLSLILLILISFTGFARTKIQGIAGKGGKVVKTSSTVTYKLQETYPSCTVTVYMAGTITPATIYTNNSGSVKANPFTASSDASFSFYADNGRYDIKFSGTGIVSPFTIADIVIFDVVDAVKANTSPTYGITALSVAPASSSIPIARGINDTVNPLSIVKTGLTGGLPNGGVNSSVTGTDSSVPGLIYTGGYFIGANNTASNIGDHNATIGVRALGNFSGLGRNDSLMGAEVISINGSGIAQDQYGIYAQTQNGGIVGQAHGVFSDVTQFGSAADMNLSTSIFQGQYRHLSTGGHALNIAGLRLSNWTKGTSTVDTSYGIYLDNTTNIGTTPWTIYSLSTAPSLFSGPINAPILAGGNLNNSVLTLKSTSFASPSSSGSAVNVIANTLKVTNDTSAPSGGFPQIVLYTDLTPTNGYGGFFRWETRNSAGTVLDATQLNGGFEVITAGSEQSVYDTFIYKSGVVRCASLSGVLGGYVPCDDNQLGLGGTGNRWSTIYSYRLNLPTTITAGGTTGAQTINKSTGTVNFAAGASSLVITNSLVTSNAILIVQARSNDATCYVKNYVPTAGSFTINMTANCTGETAVGFVLVN